MAQAIIPDAGLVQNICMDSKTDDLHLFIRLTQAHHLQWVTVPRIGMGTSASRNKMVQHLFTKQNTKDFRHRSTTREPTQGLVADTLELDRYWMRGQANHR
jgi:hypothetical protein